MRNSLWVFNGMMKKLPILMLLFFHLQLLPCLSLNSEGIALLEFKKMVEEDPFNALSDWNSDKNHCSWFGVYCSDGNVVILNLKDLCLGGILAPELGKLSHIKSIVLRNNSFRGIIPSEIANLKELEALDLGYNNFSGRIPSNLGNSLSLLILLLDNNAYLDGLSPELNQLQMLSEHQVDENELRGVSADARCNIESLSRYASRPHNSVGRSLLSSIQFLNLRNGTKSREKRSARAKIPSINRQPMRPPSRFAPSSFAPAPAVILPRNPPLLPESPAAQAASTPDPPSRATKKSGSNHKMQQGGYCKTLGHGSKWTASTSICLGCTKT
ncbi:unnamed protein product [Amaranthus hypochondriacus]